jgi:hypothetical protein
MYTAASSLRLVGGDHVDVSFNCPPSFSTDLSFRHPELPVSQYFIFLNFIVLGALQAFLLLCRELGKGPVAVSGI